MPNVVNINEELKMLGLWIIDVQELIMQLQEQAAKASIEHRNLMQRVILIEKNWE